MFWVYQSETLKLVSELETFFLFHMKSEGILYTLQLIFKFICDHITLYIFLSYHLLQYHPSLYILFFLMCPSLLLDIRTCVLTIFVPALSRTQWGLKKCWLN